MRRNTTIIILVAIAIVAVIGMIAMNNDTDISGNTYNDTISPASGPNSGTSMIAPSDTRDNGWTNDTTGGSGVTPSP